MVNASELRIGNWAVNYGNYVCIEADDIVDCHYSPESYDPISLTPEILEKAGFRIDPNSKKHAGKVHRCQGITINLETSRIKYLHQLQNLYFALTGEELQIELYPTKTQTP